MDATLWDDSEFTSPAIHGEQGRMDLLTVLAHEIAHLLGFDHDADGTMADSLTTGTRRTPTGSWSLENAALLNLMFAGETNTVALPRGNENAQQPGCS